MIPFIFFAEASLQRALLAASVCVLINHLTEMAYVQQSTLKKQFWELVKWATYLALSYLLLLFFLGGQYTHNKGGTTTLDVIKLIGLVRIILYTFGLTVILRVVALSLDQWLRMSRNKR